MTHMNKRLGALIAVAGAFLGIAAPTQACSLDGVPSISAGGALAHRNTVQPTAATLARWAEFVFPAGYRRGHAVRFAENVAELHRSLPPEAFRQAWRWDFGDGSGGSGYAVSHTYRRAGEYKVTVYAKFGANRAWYVFDAALIRIR